MLFRITGILLLAGIATADAAANIPSSELPGRERYRFQESPLDRFTQPGTPRRTDPLWNWNCKTGKTVRGKKRSRKKGC